MKNYGKRFKEVRLQKNLSITEVAEASGYCCRTIYNWENDIHEPNAKAIRILVKIYDVTVDYFLGLSNTSKK